MCERDIAEQAGPAAHAHADEELGGPRLGERYQDVASSSLVADGINRDLVEKAQFQEACSRPVNGDGVVQRFGVELQLPADNALLSDVIAANDDVADVVLVLLGNLEHHVDQGRLSGHVGNPRRRRQVGVQVDDLRLDPGHDVAHFTVSADQGPGIRAELEGVHELPLAQPDPPRQLGVAEGGVALEHDHVDLIPMVLGDNEHHRHLGPAIVIFQPVADLRPEKTLFPVEVPQDVDVLLDLFHVQRAP